MEPELSARSVSVEILIEFDHEKNLDYSLANELDTREKAQVREYVQNILRKRSYLDFLIDHFSSVGIEEMKPELKNILRLAIYDMLFMDSTPDCAAINEAVEISKKFGTKDSASFINGILDTIAKS